MLFRSGLAGDDRLDGGQGADIIYGGEGADRLGGGSGDDILDASQGTPSKWGTYMLPGLGKDTVIGNEALWKSMDGIDLGYWNIGDVGGITFNVGENGSGTVVSGDGQVDKENMMIELDEELSQWNKVKNIAISKRNGGISSAGAAQATGLVPNIGSDPHVGTVKPAPPEVIACPIMSFSTA